MSQEAIAARAYEKRVVNDALRRLAGRLDRTSIPLTDEELATLVRRAREAFYAGERRRQRLVRYQAHLARTHGEAQVSAVSAVITDVLNEIGYEEK